jgi:hypothetical protein
MRKRKSLRAKPVLRVKEPTPIAPLSLEQKFRDNPYMINATGQGFQAMILGHSKNEPKPESKKSMSPALQYALDELAKVDLRNG